MGTTAVSDPPTSCDTLQAPSAHPGSSDASTVILSQEEYDRLRQLAFSQNRYSVTHASSSGMHAYIVVSQKP